MGRAFGVKCQTNKVTILANPYESSDKNKKIFSIFIVFWFNPSCYVMFQSVFCSPIKFIMFEVNSILLFALEILLITFLFVLVCLYFFKAVVAFYVKLTCLLCGSGFFPQSKDRPQGQLEMQNCPAET